MIFSRTGKYLRKMRQDAGFSQGEMSALVFASDMDTSHIADIEAGKHEVSLLHAIKWFIYCSVRVRQLECFYPAVKQIRDKQPLNKIVFINPDAVLFIAVSVCFGIVASMFG